MKMTTWQHRVCAVPESIAPETPRCFKPPSSGLAGTGVNVWPLKSLETVLLSRAKQDGIPGTGNREQPQVVQRQAFQIGTMTRV